MKNLKAIRLAKGLTQAEAARELNISRQAYYNYETGKREADYETLLRIGELFDVSVEELIRDDPKEFEKKETLSGQIAKKRLEKIIQKKDLTELIELEKIVNQLSEHDIEDLLHYAELLLLKQKVQTDKADQSDV